MSETPWQDPTPPVDSDSARTARYRRLQSWYREVQLGARPGSAKGRPELGSMLHADEVAAQPALNFLHPGAFAHAERRIAEVQAENGALDPVRLTHNMLSSMPLCFNLFGALGSESQFLGLFQACFDGAATSITDVVCEWAPTGGSAEANLGDRTAFDAVVFYERADGPAFMGIETKYTEPFSQKEYTSHRYDEVARGCGWFADPDQAIQRLTAKGSNQLWRNLLLAAALDAEGSRGRGAVSVVCLADDPGAQRAMDAVTAELAPTASDRLQVVSLESIVDSVAGVAPELTGWAGRFRSRYLDVEQPDRGVQRHPDGPRLGDPLTRP